MPVLNQIGIGIEKLSTGDAYHGEWKNDMRHGKGEAVMATRDHYIGDVCPSSMYYLFIIYLFIYLSIKQSFFIGFRSNNDE